MDRFQFQNQLQLSLHIHLNTAKSALTIGEKVTKIGEYAFSYCSGLSGSLVIPDLVVDIGSYSFQYCIGLTSIKLNQVDENIGKYAFSYCPSISEIGKLSFGLTDFSDVVYRGASAPICSSSFSQKENFIAHVSKSFNDTKFCGLETVADIPIESASPSEIITSNDETTASLIGETVTLIITEIVNDDGNKEEEGKSKSYKNKIIYITVGCVAGVIVIALAVIIHLVVMKKKKKDVVEDENVSQSMVMYNNYEYYLDH